MADITSKEHKFNEWWNADNVIMNNPYKEYSPAYWAWEGWCAGYDAGVQEGIQREHAMWQLAKIGQEIEHVHKTEKNEYD